MELVPTLREISCASALHSGLERLARKVKVIRRLKINISVFGFNRKLFGERRINLNEKIYSEPFPYTINYYSYLLISKNREASDEFPIFRATCVPPKWRDKLQEQTPSVT